MKKALRNPNGYGSIKKLSGKRRKPYAVMVTTGWDVQNGKAVQIQKAISYHEDRKDAMYELAKYNRLMFNVDMRRMTFQEVYNALYEEEFSRMKPATLKSYTSAYNKCEPLYGIKMADIRKMHMQRIMNAHSDLSESSQKNILKLFHIMYKYCLENDICEKDYSRFVQLRSEQEKEIKHPFTREEVHILWENIDTVFPFQTGDIKGRKMIGWILFMIYTGVRIGEMLNIKKEDVHLEERYIHIPGTKTQSADRIIPIHRKIESIISANLENDSEYLFSIKGKKTYDGYFRLNFFYPACCYFGMQHKPHECRHTFISFAAASKMDQVLLKKIVGHRAKNITEDTYTHVFLADLTKEIDKFEI